MARVFWTASSLPDNLRSLKFPFAYWGLGAGFIAAFLFVFGATVIVVLHQALTHFQFVIRFLFVNAVFFGRTSAFVLFAASFFINHMDHLIKFAFRQRRWRAEVRITPGEEKRKLLIRVK